MNPDELLGDYDPLDPESEPNRELKDHIAEPIDLWCLDHGTVDADTFEDARELWTEMGDPLEGEAPIDAPEAGESGHMRTVTPPTMEQFAEKLQPMIFESAELAMVPMAIMSRLNHRQIIAGKMVGVPVDDGYAPTLLLTVNIEEDAADIIHQTLQTVHILNDVYGDESEDMQVLF